MWRAQIDHLLRSGSNLASAYGDRRTNEELVRGLLGQIEGNETHNLHTGLKVSEVRTKEAVISALSTN